MCDPPTGHPSHVPACAVQHLQVTHMGAPLPPKPPLPPLPRSHSALAVMPPKEHGWPALPPLSAAAAAAVAKAAAAGTSGTGAAGPGPSPGPGPAPGPAPSNAIMCEEQLAVDAKVGGRRLGAQTAWAWCV